MIIYNKNKKYYLKYGGYEMASKMLHTCIRVKDLDKSLKFYKEALGLIETRRMDYPEYKIFFSVSFR